MKLLTTALLILLTLGMVQAEPREKHEKCEKHESHNYIIERQEAGLVQGVPTMRRIIGKRGRVIQSIRQLARAAGSTEGAKVSVDVAE